MYLLLWHFLRASKEYGMTSRLSDFAYVANVAYILNYDVIHCMSCQNNNLDSLHLLFLDLKMRPVF